MDNLEPVERIFVSFTLIGESLIPDEITSKLGISPDLSFKRGDVEGIYEGKKIERSHGVWEIVSDNRGLPSDDAISQLKWLVNLLEPVKEILHQILEDKTIQATIGYFWIAPNGRINVEFEPKLLSQLASLDVKIRFDIYGDYSWMGFMTSLSWNELISKLPNPHFLQTYEWGQVKAKYGWIPYYAAWTNDGKFYVSTDLQSLISNHYVAAALILKRQILSRGFVARSSILYAPKGPLLDWNNASLRTRVLNDLQSFAKQQSAIFLKIDPDIVLGRGVSDSGEDVTENSGQAARSELTRRGWVYSSDQIQFQNTVLIDLSATEEEILARMKPKTRYNVRLAEKKGVTVRTGTVDDLPMLYKMYAETSVRDGFVIRDENYYMTVWKLFMQDQSSTFDLQPLTMPLIAEVDGQPVAAIFMFTFAGRAYYVYGMSRNLHREKMPTYLLQWEAMKRAKSNGCSAYDLWGAPEVFDESDSMWGVYRFKEGLGGEVIRTLGAYDFVPNKLWYKLYTEIVPRVLDVMRSRGKEKTKLGLSA